MINDQPLTRENIDHFTDLYHDPRTEVELSAHNGDPQAERDAVHIGRYMMQSGRNPWPTSTNPIPFSSLNTGANGVRKKMGWPLEYAEQLQPEIEELHRASFSASTVSVSSEMSVESKWTVIALGEMQQPGGVGATQDAYNPQIDGPNPDGPNFMDNSQNSPEQEKALQTWVNHVINMLNQGKLEDEILAQLAQDGCPDPQSVMARALEQNLEQPVSNEAGTDAFDMPVNQEPMSGGNESPNMTPQSVAASTRVASGGEWVKVKKTGSVGKVVASNLDVWGEGVLKVRLASGELADFRPAQVTATDEPLTSADPLAEIQAFIDSIPEPGETRASVEARIDNLTTASLMLHDARIARRASTTDRIRADQLKLEVDGELSDLRHARNKLQESDLDYLDTRPGYRINAFAVADGDSPIDPTFARRIAEDATILVQELPQEMIVDPLGVELRAFHHAAANYASDEATDTFLAEVERQRIARVTGTKRVVSTSPKTNPFEPDFEPFEGAAEQLFL